MMLSASNMQKKSSLVARFRPLMVIQFSKLRDSNAGWILVRATVRGCFQESHCSVQVGVGGEQRSMGMVLASVHVSWLVVEALC